MRIWGFQGDGETLGCREDRRAAAARRVVLRAAQDGVDLVVAVRRIVVEQRELTDSRLVGDVHRVFDRAVSPMTLVRELRLRVLRVVDQQVGTVGELEDLVRNEVVAFDAGPTPTRLTVVGDVGDGHATDLDPVAERGSDVADPARTHLGRADREVVVAGVVETQRRVRVRRV